MRRHHARVGKRSIDGPITSNASERPPATMIASGSSTLASAASPRPKSRRTDRLQPRHLRHQYVPQ